MLVLTCRHVLHCTYYIGTSDKTDGQCHVRCEAETQATFYNRELDFILVHAFILKPALQVIAMTAWPQFQLSENQLGARDTSLNYVSA